MIIELNFYRIEGLFENFIYFNDDMYLIKDVKFLDFFKNNKLRFLVVYDVLVLWFLYINIYYNNVELIYCYFFKK